jgi:glucose-6-phosphate 1-dehydrogenase
MCYYHHGESYGDESAYSRMIHEIASTATFNASEANVMYYLAIPPNVFHETVETLEKIPTAIVPGKTKVVIEKPFGRDTESCKELLQNFEGLGEEMQYRLDHYLAVS